MRTKAAAPSLIVELARRIKAGELTYCGVADKCGVTEGAVRSWAAQDRLPRNPLVRAALEKAVSK
jgi:hypothetical protein